MSRFDLYGDKRCENCVYFRRSTRCPVNRCDHEHNLGSNWLGVTYKRIPDAINMFNKCKYYEPKETP